MREPLWLSIFFLASRGLEMKTGFAVIGLSTAPSAILFACMLTDLIFHLECASAWTSKPKSQMKLLKFCKSLFRKSQIWRASLCRFYFHL